MSTSSCSLNLCVLREQSTISQQCNVTVPYDMTVDHIAHNEAEIQAQISAHHKSRSSLISHEKALRHDHAFSGSLSHIARRACQIVKDIRTWEAENIWVKEANKSQSCTSNSDDEKKVEVFPGMVFTLAKQRMERTMLWKIVKRMPKGALLHAHMEAMVDVDWLLGLALETPGICILSNTGPILTQKDLPTADIRFTYLPPNDSIHQPSSKHNIYHPDYVPGTPIPITKAASTFPFQFLPPHGSFPLPAVSCSKTSAFLAWLQSRTTITPHESLLHHQGVNNIWAKFQSIFPILHGIIYYEPVLRKFVTHLMDSLYKDGVCWVETRLAFHMTLQEADTGAPLTHTDVIRIYGEEVAAYKSANPGFWGSRIIWTGLRALSPEIVKDNMQGCITAKLAHPEVIAGYDLVGQEDSGRSLLSHLPELYWFKNECQRLGVDIPFFFHAGETLGDGTPADENLYDAILLGTKRIGHGFSLYKHPYLLELVKEKNICVEVCPISNEILRLTASVLQHPLPALLAQGVPVAVSNDDPGILGQKTTGSATHDMWQVVQAFDNVGLGGLGDLCRTSIEMAYWVGGEKEKEKRVAEWMGMWEEFCEWVVAEYGEK